MNNNDQQTKISYLKQIEDLIKSNVFDKYQKEIKAMRVGIDNISKAGTPVIEKLKVAKQDVKESKKPETERPANTTFVRPSSNNNFANRQNNNKKEFDNKKPFEKNFKSNSSATQRDFRANNNNKFVPNNKKTSLNEFRKSAEAVAVNIDNSKNKFTNKNGGKKKFNKDFDEEFSYKKGNKRFDDEDDIFANDSNNKKNKQRVNPVIEIKKATMTSEKITVKEFSEKIGKTVAEIVKKLMLLGVMANINSYIDYDTAALIADEFGIELEKKVEKTAEEVMVDNRNIVDSEENLVPRPPIITVMGHVDHGKTSLLDAIKKTNIASNEAGGITQHIGAYTITKNGRQITFIDTPGHEAFTAMRARGANVTDIAVLVVAADDGIKPQTVEAIKHIKNAKVPMIVAINKIDTPQANVERVKQQLTEYDVLPEEWGGDAIVVPISAKTGEGIDKLLEIMLLVADVENFRANPNRPAVAVVIESKLDRGRGPLATLLIQNGTLKIGNTMVCGTSIAKIRAMVDFNGNNVVSASPSYAVEVLGFSEVPKAGEIAQVVDEKLAKQIVQERKVKEQIELAQAGNGVSIDEFMKKTKDMTILNLIVKADVQGSLEAIKQSVSAIKNDEVEIHCIHGGVGNVSENDVMLAQTANAMIVAFNVKTEAKALKFADKQGIKIKNYKIIYDMLDDINMAVKALVKPKYKETFIGTAEVRMVYKITGSGLIAGCMVKKGSVKRGAIAKVYRGDELIVETVIDGLKQFKDDVKEVTEGFECGIKLRDPEFKEGDLINVYINEEIKE